MRMARQTFSETAIQETDTVIRPWVSIGQSTGVLDLKGSTLGVLGMDVMLKKCFEAGLYH